MCLSMLCIVQRSSLFHRHFFQEFLIPSIISSALSVSKWCIMSRVFFCLFHPCACFVNCDLLCTHHLNWAIYFPKDRSSPIEHCLMPCRHPAWQHVTQERNRLVCLACQHLLITCRCTQPSALRSFHELLLRIWVGPSGHETCNLQPAKVAWLLSPLASPS